MKWPTSTAKRARTALFGRPPPVRRDALPQPNGPDASVQAEIAFATVARSLEPFSIEILRARLRAEGIEAFVADSDLNNMNPLYSIALGGVRLLVARENAQDARLVIDLVRTGQLALREDDELV